ncbi:glycoside hydrolase family 3 protein [Cohnella hashimotonis]|uniref:beta-N-acetylhexosaminidase n=1 Tax=Cohnella hashimotonis TaxID=2826895 RepID=A0ABT6TS72_9BACL|nr:glycoside hydrolase family 3 N-terminal domain-containing protein [Cohnella hashimotonis]MDI4649073.1 glycoside hydrolase family 3 N-terminal domain-containing protein [Cohnella hashimotonis]
MKYRIIVTDRAKRIVEEMNFRRLLKQVCCPTLGHVGAERLEEFGAMFFHPMDRAELQEAIRRLKEVSEVPPFIVSDMECGPGNMIRGATKFTSMMGLSQANSEELAYEVGRIAAAEAGEIGFNWTFSPVADIASDADSPVVSTRSAGHKPEQVVKIAGGYMKGLQEHGMMATIKHFPGDGFSSWDQHLTTPNLPLDAASWRNGPGRVFRELIDQGAMAVMPGHIALPAFDEPDARGLYPPATVSRKLLIELLRQELGFEGLIVSDAINMGGVVGYMNYYDACAAALTNGCDMLLFPQMDERFYAEMERRHREGSLTLATLRDRASRIVSLKEQFGLFGASSAGRGRERGEQAIAGRQPEGQEVPGQEIAGQKIAGQEIAASNSAARSAGAEQEGAVPDKAARAVAVAEAVSERSITIVRDREGLLPYRFTPATKVLHVVIVNNHDRYGELWERMKREIGKYAGTVDQWLDPGPDALFQVAADQAYDVMICSIGGRLSYGLNVVRLHDEVARNMMGGWTKLGTPVIFIAHFHPFVHKEYAASIDTIVNTYGDIDCTAEQLLKAIAGAGERPINARLFAHD